MCHVTHFLDGLDDTIKNSTTVLSTTGDVYLQDTSGNDIVERIYKDIDNAYYYTPKPILQKYPQNPFCNRLSVLDKACSLMICRIAVKNAMIQVEMAHDPDIKMALSHLTCSPKSFRILVFKYLMRLRGVIIGHEALDIVLGKVMEIFSQNARTIALYLLNKLSDRDLNLPTQNMIRGDNFVFLPQISSLLIKMAEVKKEDYSNDKWEDINFLLEPNGTLNFEQFYKSIGLPELVLKKAFPK